MGPMTTYPTRATRWGVAGRFRQLLFAILVVIGAPSWALVPMVGTWSTWSPWNWDSSQYNYQPPAGANWTTSAEGLNVLHSLAEAKLQSLAVRGHLSPNCWTYTPYSGTTDTYKFVGEGFGGCAGGGLEVRSYLSYACPANSIPTSGGCLCADQFFEDPSRTACIKPPEPESAAGPMCMRGALSTAPRPSGERVGHPILPATGEKYRREIDMVDGGAAPLEFSRTYRSSWGSILREIKERWPRSGLTTTALASG